MIAHAEPIRRNRVFKMTVLFSLVIHLLIFMKITGFYQSRAISCIELTMKEIFTPSGRSIPRPLKRFKSIQPADIKKTIIKERNIAPINMNPHDLNSNSSISEDFNVIPEGVISEAAQWVSTESLTGLITSKDYYDMMLMKIEQNKKYPQRAKKLHQQGQVTVAFIIDLQGALSLLRVVKGSRFKTLDRAALEAVRKSAPFPVPPVSLFKEPLKLELTILFELT